MGITKAEALKAVDRERGPVSALFFCGKRANLPV